jgi:hypothetical protein
VAIGPRFQQVARQDAELLRVLSGISIIPIFHAQGLTANRYDKQDLEMCIDQAVLKIDQRVAAEIAKKLERSL